MSNDNVYDFESGPLKAKMDLLKDRLEGNVPVSAAEALGLPDPLDFSEYNIPAGIQHMYEKCTAEYVGGDPMLVAPFIEFDTVSMPYKKCADYIQDKVNGPEQWQLVSFVPNGSGMLGVVLQRNSRVRLPVPSKIGDPEQLDFELDPGLAVEGAEWSKDDN